MYADLRVTLPGFKSLVPDIHDLQVLTIFDLLQGSINTNRITCDKQGLWSSDELNRLRIDFTRVDRLYHAKFDRGAPLQSTIDEGKATAAQLEVVVRMHYNGTFIFAELVLDCVIPCMPISWENKGTLFVSYSANIFFNTIQTVTDKRLFYESLMEDNYNFPWIYDDTLILKAEHTFPSLKYLCNKALTEDSKRVDYYVKVLPSVLGKSLSDFSDIAKARHIYNIMVYPAARHYLAFEDNNLYWSDANSYESFENFFRWIGM
ncbi:uncharacterized protein LOC121864896 [Homarus americanus]|uniref:Uncharacterized protein n=1 Tax=Homarus americanus TaxID=6706 RepID=A0A8J5N014_HOMAM|nr:uncharacterized protein LOC121864896 [Homarus americanus]KAG7169969.1 hypothetical protein Hamer_G012182 [Homarus americanus]